MDAETKKVLNNYEKRISFIEQKLGLNNIKPEKRERKTIVQKINVPSMSSISFNQVITSLGVIGLIIGVLSFFFYAVANRWIGETAQVLIGVILGLILLSIAYIFHEKKPNWSNTIFGGAYAIEYISLGIGVSLYKVIPTQIGIILTAVICLSSIILAWKFNSRMIVYFAVVGGFLIPFITLTFESQLFILTLYTLLSIALVILSLKNQWGDVRLISFLIIALYFSIATIIQGSTSLTITFLIIIFILHHIASLLSSMKKNDLMDTLILIALPIFFFSMLKNLLNWSIIQFGMLTLISSLVQLIEMYLLKRTINKNSLLTLIGTGTILLNIGIFFLLEKVQYGHYLIIFLIQQIIFAYLAKKNGEKTYLIASYIFLFLSIMQLLLAPFQMLNRVNGTLIVITSLIAVGSFYYQYKTYIDEKVSGVVFLLSGFWTLFIITSYLRLFIGGKIAQILLTVFWLIYTIIMYDRIDVKKIKILISVLLGITLIKIAFVDLLFLSGIYRILGFILFGILLIVGGLLIKK